MNLSELILHLLDLSKRYGNIPVCFDVDDVDSLLINTITVCQDNSGLFVNFGNK